MVGNTIARGRTYGCATNRPVIIDDKTVIFVRIITLSFGRQI